MKKILFILAAVIIAFSAGAKVSNDTTVCFKISPAMSCINCETKIKTNLRYEKGISAIEATAPGDQVKIKFNKTKTDAAKIAKAFGKIGYKAIPANACELKGHNGKTTCGKTKYCNKAATCCQDKKDCSKTTNQCTKSSNQCSKSTNHCNK